MKKLHIWALGLATALVVGSGGGMSIAAESNPTRTSGGSICSTAEKQVLSAAALAEGDISRLDAEIEQRLRRLDELRRRARQLVPVVYETRCCR